MATRSTHHQQNERVRVNVLHTKGLWQNTEEAAALFGIRGDRLVLWPRRASFTFKSKIVSACPAEACQVDRPFQHRYSPFDLVDDLMFVRTKSDAGCFLLDVMEAPNSRQRLRQNRGTLSRDMRCH